MCAYDPDYGAAVSFGDVLKKVLARYKFEHKGRHPGLVKAWKEMVGEQVAQKTSIGAFANGCLTIEVESSVLLHELNSFMKGQLLGAFQQTKAGRDVAEIRFRLKNGV
jgi:hypothetical protein